VKSAAVVAGVLIALALQTAVAPFVFVRGGAIDLVLVVVIWTALQFGPAAGLLTGMAAGLAQDALSGGIIGVGGFSKTLVGFIAGVVGSQFIVAGAVQRFVVLFVGAAAHTFCFLGLYAVIERRGFEMPWRQAGLQAVTTAVVGIVLIQAALAVPGMLMRRRLRRGY
jgi:rod shape-determining protein MreD